MMSDYHNQQWIYGFWSTYWWSYMFGKRYDANTSWLKLLLCRLRGHPYMSVWREYGYDLVPCCRNCGDDFDA